MVFRKKANKRAPKRNMRKRKGNRKPAVVRTNQLISFNTMKPKPQVFKKTALFQYNATNLIQGPIFAATILGGATVGSMPDFTPISNLYNRYKMLKVTYTFNLQAIANSLSNYDLPRIWCRYNYDSNLVSGDILTKMQECPNTKSFQFTAEKTQMSYTYYPRCIEPVYLSGISTGYRLAKQQFVDCQYATVPHYGIMVYVDNISANLFISYDISYEVAFKYQD